jgi:replicative DNA helicase
MKSVRLVKRILAAGARVSGTKMKTGYLTESELAAVSNYSDLLKSRSVFIDDTSGLTIAEITARAKRIALQHDIGMIVVDYVQLANGTGENRALEVGKISAGLLGLGKDLNVAMVALSQLNRNVEARVDKRPMISDLKESGSLEQDADVIMLLYRDELYHQDSPHKGIAEIIIGKGRDIGNWTVKVGFNGERTEFYDLAQSKYMQNDGA